MKGGNIGTTGDDIQNTQDQVLFNTERWGSFTYELPLKEGSYDITLFLAETYFGPAQAGNRVFDIEAEGSVILDDFDPLVTVGHDAAYQIDIDDIQVNDGKLTLDFVPSKDQASLRGLVVRGIEGNTLPQDPDALGTVGDGPVPSDCGQNIPVGTDDFVLFDGGDAFSVSNDTIELHQSWILNEVWAAPQGAKIDIVDTVDGQAISYSNAGIFTGYKMTPPLAFGEQRHFHLSGVDLWVETNKDMPEFGLRVIKPGENEGNGGASTTTWVRNSNGQQDFATTPGCELLSLTMPSNWDNANQEAKRFILEVKNGWNTTHELRVRRMVIKGFKYAD